MSGNRIERLQTGDLELGATEAVQRHVTRTVVQPAPVTQRKLDFEHARPRWLRECMAEATGVFFYGMSALILIQRCGTNADLVYPGIAATAAFLLNKANPAYSSFFQIGWAYAIGIAFAIITCAPTSGGHFNPGKPDSTDSTQESPLTASEKPSRSASGYGKASLSRRFPTIFSPKSLALS